MSVTPAEQQETLRALDWLAVDRARSAQVLAAVIRLGLPEPYATAEDLTGDAARSQEILALHERVPGPWAGDPGALLETIALVGAAVWVEESENVEEWASVARRALDLAAAAKESWPYRSDHRSWLELPGAQLVDTFRRAGRGPTYAHAMLDAAARAKTAPDTFGYGAQITPAAFLALTSAGVNTADELERYLHCGVTLEEAISLAEQRVSADALVFAVSSDMPREQWVQLAGLPSAWFPSTADHGRGGITGYVDVQTMRYLVDNGWSNLSRYDLSGLSYGSKRNTKALSAEDLRTLAALGSKDDVKGWMGALTSGKPGNDVNDAALPPLLYRVTDVSDVAPLISALQEVGLRPSHLGTYRTAGCRSVGDVLAAVAAGITPKRAKVLTDLAGTSSVSWRPKRLASLAALRAAHVAHPEPVAAP